VFVHSIVLAAMVGVVIFLYAKVLPSNWMPSVPAPAAVVAVAAPAPAPAVPAPATPAKP